MEVYYWWIIYVHILEIVQLETKLFLPKIMYSLSLDILRLKLKGRFLQWSMKFSHNHNLHIWLFLQSQIHRQHFYKHEVADVSFSIMSRIGSVGCTCTWFSAGTHVCSLTKNFLCLCTWTRLWLSYSYSGTREDSYIECRNET